MSDPLAIGSQLPVRGSLPVTPLRPAGEPLHDAAGVPLRVMTVHAHPDDEASKGASLIARYRDAGVAATLVCCTGGEQGDVLNPELDRPEIVAGLPAVRRAELQASVSIIGYDRVELLGYPDSGMPDSEANADPHNFANAPLDEEVEALVRIIRRDRPQVVVTYSDEQEGYPHPDHLRVFEITGPALERAGDPEWYPDAGEPWSVSKLYYTVWSRARLLAMHERMLELGIESPFDDSWFERPSQDARITTRVNVAEYFGVRSDALRAHATQVDPSSPFWFALSDDEQAAIYPWDEYICARGLPERYRDQPGSEPDLFAGIAEVLT